MTVSVWHIYILRCRDGSLYAGITTDLQRRVHEHNHTSQGARYTRARRPVELAYSEEVDSRSAACRREWEIRQLKSTQKTQLILSASAVSG